MSAPENLHNKYPFALEIHKNLGFGSAEESRQHSTNQFQAHALTAHIMNIISKISSMKRA